MPSTILPRVRAFTRLTTFPRTRTFTTARSPLLAAKDTMDKDSLNTRSTEYSKTGGDDAAAKEDTAFDPSTTRPEQEEASGADKPKGEEQNPLNVSPANHKVSEPSPNESQSGGPSSRSERESKGERKVSGMGSSSKKGDAGRKL